MFDSDKTIPNRKLEDMSCQLLYNFKSHNSHKPINANGGNKTKSTSESWKEDS